MAGLQHLVDALVDARYLADSAAAVDYVRAHAVAILGRLGFWREGAGAGTLDEVAGRLGVLPELGFALLWLLEEAAWAGAAEARPGPAGAPLWAPLVSPAESFFEAARERLAARAAGTGSSLEMFDHVAAGYPDYLRGRKSGGTLLLKGAALRLWAAYFSAANPLYDIHNELGWLGLREALRRLGRPARVIEMGTGTGGGTAAILRGLRGDPEALELVAGLTITDIAPSFLLETAARLAPELPAGLALKRKRLDFDRPLAEQGIEPGGVDVLVAVNALHNYADPARGLAGLRAALADDGCLVISESLCGPGEHVHQDFVFNLLPPGAWAARSSRFLTRDAWAAALAEAGWPAEVASNRRGPQLALLALAGR